MRSEHEASLSPRDGDWTNAPDIASVRDAAREKEADAGKPAVVEEVLIEEVSIDGMCGVY
jgi:mycofactocin precursor